MMLLEGTTFDACMHVCMHLCEGSHLPRSSKRDPNSLAFGVIISRGLLMIIPSSLSTQHKVCYKAQQDDPLGGRGSSIPCRNMSRPTRYRSAIESGQMRRLDTVKDSPSYDFRTICFPRLSTIGILGSRKPGNYFVRRPQGLVWGVTWFDDATGSSYIHEHSVDLDPASIVDSNPRHRAAIHL